MITVALVKALTVRLARLRFEVPEQDLGIPLRRVPTRPRDGFVIENVRVPDARETASARPRTAPGS